MKKILLLIATLTCTVLAASFTLTEVNEPLVDVPNGKKILKLDVGIGSGAFYKRGDDTNVFYTITDRGPNIDCDDTKKVLGEKFCDKGKVFPYPQFIPTIYKIKLLSNGYEVLEKIELKTKGSKTSGLSNKDTEVAFDMNKNILEDDPNGIDPEALVVKQDGSFFIAEEYGPSIIVADKNGVVRQRWVPKGVEQTLSGADYEIISNLPAHYRDRQLNRGFESLSISPDEKTLYVALQSPLVSEKKLNKIRILEIDIDSKEVKKEYFYELDSWKSFKKDAKKKERKQNSVKVSEMVSSGPDELIVLERINATTKFYKINLKNYNGKKLEKVLLFDTDSMEGLPAKIEGHAYISKNRWILITDNDFAIKGDKTQIIDLRLD